jgi:hypothetical protein
MRRRYRRVDISHTDRRGEYTKQQLCQANMPSATLLMWLYPVQQLCINDSPEANADSSLSERATRTFSHNSNHSVALVELRHPWPGRMADPQTQWKTFGDGLERYSQ